MFDSNHKDRPCDFSEMLVSYLYNEIDADGSRKFQAHAAQCVTCSAELAEFGAVRSSIGEWRQQEFAPMGAPAIELPDPRSWIDAIRDFFTPKVALTAAGFAAAIVCIGLTFALLSSQGTGNEALMASNEQPKQNTPAVSKQDKTPEPATTGVVSPTVNVKDDETTPDTSVKTPKGREYKNYQAKSAIPNKTRAQDAPKQARHKTETLDTNLYEETEDTSLRLADLFGEADTN